MKKFFNKIVRSNSSPLIAAIEQRNLDKFKRLLHDYNSHVDVNWCTSDGRTALSVACSQVDRLIVTLLFRHPLIDINFRKPDYETAFQIAVDSNDSYIIQMFLKDPRLSSQGYIKYLALKEYEFDPIVFELILCYNLYKHVIIPNYFHIVPHHAIITFCQQVKNNLQSAVIHNQKKYRINELIAAEIYILTVCTTDKYFVVKTNNKNNYGMININDNDVKHKHDNITRFFNILDCLCLDLRMLICNRVVGLTKNSILSRDIEPASKYMLL